MIIQTDNETNVNCDISEDKSEYSFEFDNQFRISEDYELVRKVTGN